MPEVAHAREHHGDAQPVGRGDHFQSFTEPPG